MQLERFGDIWTLKHWSRTQFLLQCVKCMLLLTIPSPRLVLAHENGERFGDQANVLDELTNGTLNPIDRCRNLVQGVNLSLLYPKISYNNYMPQICLPIMEKLALAVVQAQSKPLQPFKNGL